MIKIAMMGLGNAAMAFLDLLVRQQKKDLVRQDILITAIATGRRGLWTVAGQGIKPEDLLTSLNSGLKLSQVANLIPFKGTSKDLAHHADYNVLLELSPLVISSGQPALAHIETALKNGAVAITANKGPIAWSYGALVDLAAKHKTALFLETTVMDGTPIFNLVTHTLPHCKILGVEGILNTTTNFMLDEMAKGEHLEDIIIMGQKRGFVEADPSMDIEGYDAAAKICVLANVLMQANITPDQVKRHGIAHITHGDIAVAKQAGSLIKLICKAQRTEDGSIEASVNPELIPLGHVYAACDATSSLLSITTDLMGKLTIFEHNPEIEQTAYGIYQDLLRAIAFGEANGLF